MINDVLQNIGKVLVEQCYLWLETVLELASEPVGVTWFMSGTKVRQQGSSRAASYLLLFGCWRRNAMKGRLRERSHSYDGI